MKRKCKSLFVFQLVIIGVLGLSTVSYAKSMENFKMLNEYKQQFEDVEKGKWYEDDVEICYQLGIMKGRTNTEFGISNNVTLAEAITMASRVHNIYNDSVTVIKEKEGNDWYEGVVEYAIENNIILKNDFLDYNKLATRSEMAYIFRNALPDEEFKPINKEMEIPDVKESIKYSDSIFDLYVAGVLTGSDEYGTFYPNNKINRVEVAAIINRVAIVENRKIINPLEESKIEEPIIPEQDLEEDDLQENVTLSNNVEVLDGFSLLKYMPEDKNYMVSPLSLYMALALAVNGAEDETLNEILAVMDIEDIEEYNKYAKEIIQQYNSKELDKVTLNIANSIWFNTDYYKENLNIKFKEDYKNILSEYYQATAGEVNKENAVKTINDWVSEKTNEKIKSILDDAEFLSVLINAIYFKGEWAEQFNKDNTKEDIFTDRNGKEQKVDFMNKTDEFDYYEDDTMQMVKLDYADNKTSMYVVLPKGENEIDFEKAIENKKQEKVILKMPKFKTEFDINLDSILKSMGIKTAFSDEATFENKMFDGMKEDNLKVKFDKVIQKTFIEVNEEGTEAAAVTAIGFKPTSVVVEPEPKTFIANKPFIYFIMDNENKEILFLGEYAFVE